MNDLILSLGPPVVFIDIDAREETELPMGDGEHLFGQQDVIAIVGVHDFRADSFHGIECTVDDGIYLAVCPQLAEKLGGILAGQTNAAELLMQEPADSLADPGDDVPGHINDVPYRCEKMGSCLRSPEGP